MKNKILKICIIVITIAIIVLIAVFAFVKPNAENLARQNVSEIDKVCYTSEQGIASLKIISGERENPYVINGSHENMQEFTLLIFRTDEINVQSPTFIATIDSQSYNGILEQNPYDNTFVVDLEKQISQNAQINVVITVGNHEYNFDMQNVSDEWKISYDEALNIAMEHFGEQVKQCIKGNDFNGELYVRIITDVTNTFDKFFYHVTLVDDAGQSQSVVIDVNTGEIL